MRGMAVLQVRNVPDDLHRTARILAIERGETLSAVVVRALDREVSRMKAERPDDSQEPDR